MNYFSCEVGTTFSLSGDRPDRSALYGAAQGRRDVTCTRPRRRRRSREQGDAEAPQGQLLRRSAMATERT